MEIWQGKPFIKAFLLKKSNKWKNILTNIFQIGNIICGKIIFDIRYYNENKKRLCYLWFKKKLHELVE